MFSRIRLPNFDRGLTRNSIHNKKDGFEEFLKKLVNHLPVSPTFATPLHTNKYTNANTKIPIKVKFHIRANKTLKKPKIVQ